MLTNILEYPVELVEKNPGGRNLVILLHGFGASSASWSSVMDDFAADSHVIAYDRPGFGFTPLVDRSVQPDPYSLAGQVTLLAALIEANAKGRPVILVGHSAGGLLAAEFALQHPGVAAMLILESPAIWRGSPVPPALAKMLSSAWLERFAKTWVGSFDKVGMKILRDSYFDKSKLTEEAIVAYKAPMQSADWTLNLWRFMTADQSNAVRSNLWRLDLSVFIVSGDSDRIVKVEDTFKVAERIPGHSIYLVPNCGHIAHEEQPQDFWRVVSDFISKNLKGVTSKGGL